MTGGKLYLYLQLPVVAIFCISLWFYFSFTAEDAYIVYRYAENLVNTGSLVYNVGEPINAMTSPLHAVLSAALYFATGQTVLANKIVGVALLVLSALLVWRRFGSHPQWELLAMILILLPPSMLLWAVGGLETPILLLLATLTVVLVDQPGAIRPSQLYVVFLLSSLAYVTRYDSILFFLPILLHAGLRAGSLRRVLTALAFGAMLPLAWSVTSVYYYGDSLPTSYYVKTPQRSLREILHNGRYIASYLVFVGLVPVLVMALPVALRRRTATEILYSHVRRLWWLYAASASQLLYGLTIATHHMMFGFRFFVPYLPATAILVVDLVRQLVEEPVAGRPRVREIYTAPEAGGARYPGALDFDPGLPRSATTDRHLCGWHVAVHVPRFVYLRGLGVVPSLLSSLSAHPAGIACGLRPYLGAEAR